MVKACIATEAFCIAGGGVNDDNGNGGTGGKVTANGGNVISGGRNGGNVSSWRASNGEWQWRNGEWGGLVEVASMHAGSRLQVYITPSKFRVFFRSGLADLCCCGAKEEELHGI